MGRAADRQKFRETLDDAERDCLKWSHGCLIGSDSRYSDSYWVTTASREKRSRASLLANLLISDHRFGFWRISSEAAAIPRMSPTAQRMPVSPSLITSGRPPA